MITILIALLTIVLDVIYLANPYRLWYGAVVAAYNWFIFGLAIFHPAVSLWGIIAVQAFMVAVNLLIVTLKARAARREYERAMNHFTKQG